MLERDDDVYEQVVKPLLDEARPQVDPMMCTYGLSDSPLEKKSRVNIDCE